MNVADLLEAAVDCGASDLHLVPGAPPVFRIHGDLCPQPHPALVREDVDQFLAEQLTTEQASLLARAGDVDFALQSARGERYRVNAHRQRGVVALAIRHIPQRIPTIEMLGLPHAITHFTTLERGLVLVTGPTGSGKSTTLAALVDRINRQDAVHIITLEDPTEFVFQSGRALVEQREIGRDCVTFASALRAVVRQDPDIILVGELRDHETIATALTAAETGHLVFGTLHTTSATGTIDRLIDVFPAAQQPQVRSQLSESLAGVVAQQLLPRAETAGRVAAQEVLVATRAIQRCIREEENHLIPGLIETGRKYGMQTMQQAVSALYLAGSISSETARRAGGTGEPIAGEPWQHPALAG